MKYANTTLTTLTTIASSPSVTTALTYHGASYLASSSLTITTPTSAPSPATTRVTRWTNTNLTTITISPPSFSHLSPSTTKLVYCDCTSAVNYVSELPTALSRINDSTTCHAGTTIPPTAPSSIDNPAERPSLITITTLLLTRPPNQSSSPSPSPPPPLSPPLPPSSPSSTSSASLSTTSMVVIDDGALQAPPLQRPLETPQPPPPPISAPETPQYHSPSANGRPPQLAEEKEKKVGEEMEGDEGGGKRGDGLALGFGLASVGLVVIFLAYGCSRWLRGAKNQGLPPIHLPIPAPPQAQRRQREWERDSGMVDVPLHGPRTADSEGDGRGEGSRGYGPRARDGREWIAEWRHPASRPMGGGGLVV